ncbi:hypothetical protein L249_6696 [Ophiocordyceps polyrhachis-furcata BCC 54312]|uniref:Uncharacterized protein n=1 Tax=Ophiocordyceps polyrhachis-furcata BCC 54312 TaxID=1330021 RepID=A0A367LLE2_9HYPO|nr:hypothetical protein L249_6696 [Ophiocordyceps polyrhachis-furcata BCC 54312]
MDKSYIHMPVPAGQPPGLFTNLPSAGGYSQGQNNNQQSQEMEAATLRHHQRERHMRSFVEISSKINHQRCHGKSQHEKGQMLQPRKHCLVHLGRRPNLTIAMRDAVKALPVSRLGTRSRLHLADTTAEMSNVLTPGAGRAVVFLSDYMIPSFIKVHDVNLHWPDSSFENTGGDQLWQPRFPMVTTMAMPSRPRASFHIYSYRLQHRALNIDPSKPITMKHVRSFLSPVLRPVTRCHVGFDGKRCEAEYHRQLQQVDEFTLRCKFADMKTHQEPSAAS